MIELSALLGKVVYIFLFAIIFYYSHKLYIITKAKGWLFFMVAIFSLILTQIVFVFGYLANFTYYMELYNIIMIFSWVFLALGAIFIAKGLKLI